MILIIIPELDIPFCKIKGWGVQDKLSAAILSPRRPLFLMVMKRKRIGTGFF
jgi:hypothetical protein